MRDLDIPGLSVAISRNEKLKFAAGKFEREAIEAANMCVALVCSIWLWEFAQKRDRDAVAPISRRLCVEADHRRRDPYAR